MAINQSFCPTIPPSPNPKFGKGILVGFFVELLQQILPILSYLHNQQLTHGNLSPNSILIREPDHRPVLTDFGTIIKIMAQAGFPTQTFTEKLEKLPVSSFTDGVDADLYSLGVTIVMLLTGQNLPNLFNPQSQTWDWENYKLISDRQDKICLRVFVDFNGILSSFFVIATLFTAPLSEEDNFVKIELVEHSKTFSEQIIFHITFAIF